MASHLLCRLEITTDEQRGEYMTVHRGTLLQERLAEEAAAQDETGNEIETKEEQA